MENAGKNLANSPSFETTSTTVTTPSTPNDGSRRIRMPEPKIGQGSMEGDLFVMVKKYLEIVGLVVFVWILGRTSSIDSLERTFDH